MWSLLSVVSLVGSVSCLQRSSAGLEGWAACLSAPTYFRSQSNALHTQLTRTNWGEVCLQPEDTRQVTGVVLHPVVQLLLYCLAPINHHGVVEVTNTALAGAFSSRCCGNNRHCHLQVLSHFATPELRGILIWLCGSQLGLWKAMQSSGCLSFPDLSAPLSS